MGSAQLGSAGLGSIELDQAGLGCSGVGSARTVVTGTHYEIEEAFTKPYLAYGNFRMLNKCKSNRFLWYR